MNKLYLTLSLIFFLHFIAFSQSDSVRLTTIAAKLEKLAASRPTEKAYLQFNKPNYNIGDTIWFKGYVLVGRHHQPSALSGILYVELIDTKDKIIKSLQLKNNNGIAAGEFATDDKFVPGNYRIRAYTNWMRNAGPDYFFNTTISIGNIKTGAVFITSTIDVSGKNSEGLVNAKLAYTDKFGRSFDHKVVSYEVKSDTTTLFKGTGITDDKGNLAFAFSDKAAGGQKRVNVINHIKLVSGVTIDKTIPVSLQKENADIQFFPEGGQLVNDVRSKVAFKAIGANGLGAAVKGIITDNENNEVAEFASQHAGIGIFALTPQAGKTYTAKITLADNTIITAKLPIAQEKGFVLAVNNNTGDSTKLTVRIATNNITLQEKKGTTFYLAGQSGETIYYTTLGKLDNLSFTASVLKNKFPTGIAQFTLFSATNEPLNERVVFIQNNNDLLNLNLKTEKTTYAPKEKVDMAFSSKDNTNKPATGSFSLTVYNEDRLTANENAESTILSNILLTSDLKGYIEEPNYYFNEVTDQTNADLDVLMLTQGYRRFEWKEIMDNRYPQVTYQPEKSLSISGTLTNSSDKPVAKGKLSVLALSAKTVIDTTTDADGRFVLNYVEFADSTKLVIQARKANDGRNVNISLDNNRTVPVIYKSNIADAAENDTPPFLRMAVKGAVDTAQIAANIQANIINTGKQLKEVTIKAKPDIRDLPAFKSYAMEEFDLSAEQIKSFNTMWEAMRHKITPYAGYDRVVINNITYNKGVNFDPLRLLDPIDVESATYLLSHSPGFPNTIVITTKSYAGTDTIKLKNFNKPIDFNKNNTLKDVTIKEHKIDPPDKSNLYGSVRPQAIISGTKLEDYVNIVHGLMANVTGIHYKSDKLYDARFDVIPPPGGGPAPPIPVVIDGSLMDNKLNLDDLINADRVETVKLVQSPGFKPLYGISPADPNDKVIIITTKQFAGTAGAGEKPDTLKNNAIAGNKGKTLKDVTIKDRKVAKPDQSNLYGSKPPEKIISGDKMQEMAMTRMGLEANVPNILLRQDGHIYDANPMIKNKKPDPNKGITTADLPIPIVLNGTAINYDDDIDALVTADQIENVKILRGNEFKTLYGIKYANPNDQIILITTKQFAGTAGAGEKGDTIRNNGLKKVALKEVAVKSRKNAGTELNPWQATVTASANLNGPGRADQVVPASQLESCLLLSDCLQAKIPGIIKKGDNLFFTMHMAQSITSPPPIVYMVDGVTLGSSLDMLDNNIIVSTIQTIEVLNSSSYLNVYGTAASGGLLVITTKVGNPSTNDAIAYKSVPGVIYTKFNGFYKSKEFYTPKYTVENISKTDNRTAVYWNPNITTDNTGQLPIEYFNSDVKGTYRAVVEGIDNDGNIGRFVYRYRVQ